MWGNIFKDSYLNFKIASIISPLSIHEDFRPFAKKKYVTWEFKELNPFIVINHSELKNVHEYKIILLFIFMFYYLNFIFKKIILVIYF